MAIAVDSRQPGNQTLAGNVTGATSMSWTHTMGVVSNGILRAGVGQDAGAATTSVVWDSGGTNAALTKKATGTTGTVRAETWFLKAPAVTGAKTVKASWTGSHNACGASASYSGVDQTTTFNAASPQTSTGTGNSTLTITSASGEWVFNVAVKDLGSAGSAPTKGASQNYVGADVNVGSVTIEMGCSDQLSAGASVSSTWTLAGSGNYITAGDSMIPDAGVAATNWGPWGLSDGWNRAVQP